MSRKQKKNLIRILAAVAVLLLSVLLPVADWIKIVIALVAYGLAGWDVLWGAVRIAHGQVFDEKVPRPWRRWAQSQVRTITRPVRS